MRDREKTRQISQLGYAVRLERAQAALIAWMSGCTPRMAIIRFRL
jgi:hypothetical protein